MAQISVAEQGWTTGRRPWVNRTCARGVWIAPPHTWLFPEIRDADTAADTLEPPSTT